MHTHKLVCMHVYAHVCMQATLRASSTVTVADQLGTGGASYSFDAPVISGSHLPIHAYITCLYAW